MKVRIKREQIKEYIKKYFETDCELFAVQRYSRLAKEAALSSVSSFPEEIELEISESDIVKEKSNCEKWEEIFMKIGDMETIEMVESWSKDKADLFDLNGIDATQAYEKIVEGK